MINMLEKRKGRGGGSGGGGNSSIEDNWDAPPLVKAQMAFEIIWFCFILYLITALLKAMRNVPSPQRQPYILLLISAIFLDIALIIRAIIIRAAQDIGGPPYIALSSVSELLWNQSTLLITMAGLWVFRKRSKLIMYGEGGKGFPYAGQKWKFIVDWVVTSLGLLFLSLAVIIIAAASSLYGGVSISRNKTSSDLEYQRLFDASTGLYYVQFAFYLILTIIFVVTGFTLSSAFKRKMGHPDVVRHFPTRLRTPINFSTGHQSDADLGHALARHSCNRVPI